MKNSKKGSNTTKHSGLKKHKSNPPKFNTTRSRQAFEDNEKDEEAYNLVRQYI